MPPASSLILFCCLISEFRGGNAKDRPGIEPGRSFGSGSTNVTDDPDLRVMTFNIWQSGANVENGLFKIAKHILYVYPDVVALQEVESEEILTKLVRLLGPEWSAVGNRRGGDYPDTAVLTRHDVLPDPPDPRWGAGPAEENGAVRARVAVAGPFRRLVVNFWSLHLDYHDYGPYAMCNKLVTEERQIDAGERYEGGDTPGRVQNIGAITIDPAFLRDLDRAAGAPAPGEPMLVAGDLNCPSHLDYTDAARDAHCGWAYRWPATGRLTGLGLTDAYRRLEPDPVRRPGTTWSTVQKRQEGWGYTIPEPQDRIDMVFYKGGGLEPVAAQVYSGSEPLLPKPRHFGNDWPSDHASVVVDFKIKV